MADATFRENLIFNSLVHNEEFFYKVFPHLSDTYFEGPERVLFYSIKKHFDKYEKPAKVEMLKLYIQDNKHVNEDVFTEALNYIDEHVRERKEVEFDWMVDQTEYFCQDKALYNALAKSVTIYDGDDEKDPKSGIPEILQEALSVSFNTDIGLDYTEDAEERFRRLRAKTDKLPFSLPILNEITKGGFERKTCNAILASTNVGKSAFMTHYTAEMASQGYNVLYLTMEMAEEKLATRIDANLMQKSMDEIEEMSEQDFATSIDKLKAKTLGKIIIKEFPTSSTHMGHIEALLRELKNKKGFVPDIVCLDYLNICLSKRVSLSAGTYLFVKAITEEFRGLAVKYNFVGVTATQGTRSTIGSSDISMQDTGESKGVNDTLDFLLGMMAPEDIAKEGLMLCKQLKSRYNDVNIKQKFVLAFDRPRMTFNETEDTGICAGFLGDKDDANDISGDSASLFDRSTDNRFLSDGDVAKSLLGSIKF